MTCRHCQGSSCCHSWATPKSCPPRRNWFWLLVAMLALVCGLLPSIIVGLVEAQATA